MGRVCTLELVMLSFLCLCILNKLVSSDWSFVSILVIQFHVDYTGWMKGKVNSMRVYQLTIHI